MRLDLLGDQVAFGDFHLLILGVAFEADDFHPVKQRLRQVEAVCGADEHHVRQVVIQLQIVVLELAVLFGIEHLEQRRGGIATEILTQLVDLVEQEQRIAGPGLLEVGYDLARQRADIGAAVTANLGLVAHPAQRLADEFATRRLGDRLAQAGLAHARRADQAQDRAFEPVGSRLNREVLDDPVLDLVERVMIGIEHGLRGVDILLELAFLAPGQPQQNVEIVADHGRFGAHRLHRAQLLDLGIGLGARFLGELELVDPVLQLLDLVGFLAVAAAQLALDRLQLLVEVIFALGLLHLALDPPADLAFDLEHAQLAFHEGIDHFQPLERIGLGEQRLLVRNLGLDMLGYRIRELPGIDHFAQILACVLWQLLVELGIFAKGFDYRAHHRGNLVARDADRLHRVNRRNHHLVRAALLVAQRFKYGALLGLDQNPYSPIGQLEQLKHGGDHADIVEIVAVGFVAAGVELGEQEDVLVAGHRRFKRGNRFLAPHEKGHDHAGKHDDVAQRQQR